MRTNLSSVIAGRFDSPRRSVAANTRLLAPALIGRCSLGAETGYWHFRKRNLQVSAESTDDDALPLGTTQVLRIQ